MKIQPSWEQIQEWRRQGLIEGTVCANNNALIRTNILFADKSYACYGECTAGPYSGPFFKMFESGAFNGMTLAQMFLNWVQSEIFPEEALAQRMAMVPLLGLTFEEMRRFMMNQPFLSVADGTLYELDKMSNYDRSRPIELPADMPYWAKVSNVCAGGWTDKVFHACVVVPMGLGYADAYGAGVPDGFRVCEDAGLKARMLEKFSYSAMYDLVMPWRDEVIAFAARL